MHYGSSTNQWVSVDALLSSISIVAVQHRQYHHCHSRRLDPLSVGEYDLLWCLDVQHILLFASNQPATIR